MTTIEAAPPRAGLATRAPTRRRSRRSSVFVLAGVEGRRLVRRPLFLVAATASLVPIVLVTRTSAAVLQRDGILIGIFLSPVAGATFLLTNLAATRSRRHGTDELLETTPTTASGRSLAHLLSVGWVVGAAVLLVAVQVWYLMTRRPTGTPDVLELAVGPAMVAITGVLGVAIARWWPSVVAAPLSFVALGGLELYLMFQLSSRTSAHFGQHLRWLGFWVPISTTGNPPRELVIRPSAWHLLFLVGLAVLFGSVAILRHGVRPAPLGWGAVSLTLVTLAAANQVQLPTAREQRALADLVVHPGRHRVCRVESTVRYCAYPGYVSWIDRWSPPVSGVLGHVPPGHRPQGLSIGQTLTFWGGDVPIGPDGRLIGPNGNELPSPPPASDPPVTVTDQWGAGSNEGQYALELALVVAAKAVAIPIGHFRLTAADIRAAARSMLPRDRRDYLATTKAGDLSTYCHTRGQARSVVALWLAAQATPATRQALLDDLRLWPYGLYSRPAGTAPGYFQLVARRGRSDLLYRGPYLDPISDGGYLLGSEFPVLLGNAEARYAARLMTKPGATVEDVMTTHWRELTDPYTPVGVLLRLFGMRRLPSLRTQLRDARLDPNRALALENGIGYGAVPCP